MKKTSSNNPGKKLFVLLFVLPLVVLSALGAAAFPGGSGLAAANEEVVSSYRSVHEKISAVMPPAGPQQAAAMPLLAVSLSSGDLAVLGYNSDGAADDVAIVALASIPDGTVIFITNNGWNTSTGSFTTGGEAIITWTTPAIPAGTIVNANSLPGTSAGSLTSLSNFGDQILIYQTVDDTSGGTPTIIYAFNNNVAALDTVGQWQTTVTDQISESNLPAGTTEVTTSGGAGNAFGLLGEVDNLVYTGPTTYADKATWLSWIHTVANWTTSNTVPQDIAPGGANLPTSVPVGVLGPTPTDTPTPIPPTPTPTDTPTPIPPTPTPTDTATPIPPTPTPTATDTPTPIPPTPTPTATDTPTPIPPTPTPTDTPTPIPPTPTPTNTPIPQPMLYVSSSSSGSAGGVSFTDDDILSYDPSSSTWSMVFDGSDVGLDEDLNGFLLLNDGSILITVKESDTLPGIGSVDDSDIVQFFPISLGDHTAGTFTLFFDGSDVGLTTNGEGVDSIGVSPDGRLVVSTEDTFNVPGVSGEDEDLLVFNVTSFGSTTSGTFEVYFDGSDVALGGEDVEGSWIDPVNNDIYLTVSNLFSVTGASGEGADVFTCAPSSLGDTTACTYSLYWDGSAVGFGGENTDGLSLGSDAVIIVPGAGPTPTNTPVPPTPTPTNTPTPIPPRLLRQIR